MKIKNIKSISIAFMVIILLLAFLLAVPFPSGKSFAENSGSSTSPILAENGFNINVYDKDEQGQESLVNEDETASYYNGKAHVYRWINADVFHFTLNSEKLNVQPEHDTNGDYYQISLSINFLKSYKEKQNFNEGGAVGSKPLKKYETRLRSKEEINNYQSTFDINEGVEITQENSAYGAGFIQGWGIYRFELRVNNKPIYSDYYAIEPVKEILYRPNVQMTVSKSTDTFETEFVFTLKNYEEYKYIDETKLVWYAKGKAQDGFVYCLSKSDLLNSRFRDCDDGLLESPERNGTTFKFKDNGHYGDWEVWCEYQAEGSDLINESDHFKFTTKKSINYWIILGISLGVITLSIIVTVAICLFKIKREKVY